MRRAAAAAGPMSSPRCARSRASSEVANLVCTTDCSSANSSAITAPAAVATGLSAAAVMATVAVDPSTRASKSRISVVVPDLDKMTTRS